MKKNTALLLVIYSIFVTVSLSLNA